MRYKNNILDKLDQVEIAVNKIQFQLNRGIDQDQIGETIDSLKEQIEKESLALQSKDDEKVKSLVKIYENMNPKRAAQIFDEIELETLMQIIQGIL